MPTGALSRVGARVVESGPGGQDLAAGTWRRLEALSDPRSPRGRIYPLASGGLGIPGMRERAELLSGTLDAGPGPGGGFTVTTRLPIQKGREGLPGQEIQEGLK